MKVELTQELLDEIERGCDGATPGPWRLDGRDIWGSCLNEGDEKAYHFGWPIFRMYTSTSSEAERQATGAHIARLDPATVHALISAARIGLEVRSVDFNEPLVDQVRRIVVACLSSSMLRIAMGRLTIPEEERGRLYDEPKVDRDQPSDIPLTIYQAMGTEHA